jgi:hypothetical protein
VKGKRTPPKTNKIKKKSEGKKKEMDVNERKNGIL